jgi:hypothetical protein
MADAEPLTLADEHRRVLETIYDVLRTQGKWPPYEYLEVVLDRKFDIDLEEQSKTIPAGLTTLPRAPYPPSPGQEVAITIEGLQHCPQAAQDVAGFFRVFRRFVEAEKSLIPTSFDSIVRPSLTTDGLSTEWSVHPNDLVRVFRVLSLEPWVEGVTASDKTIQITAGRRFRDFRTAMTIEQYLERRRQRHKPVRSGSEFRGPGDPDMYRRFAVSSGHEVERHEEKEWDAFIAHASADKDSVVRPLAGALRRAGLRVWLDEFELTVGDSLRRKIDEGLVRSRFGVVVLSPSFFEREWPQTELDGLAQKEIDGRKVILPVWHRITAEQVRAKSLTLAGRMSVSWDRGITEVVKELLRAMGQPGDALKRATDEPGQVAELMTDEPGAAATSTTDVPTNQYREIARLLRQQEFAAVGKRARVLGGELRRAVTDWMESNPTVPTSISTKPQLESWEPVFKPLLDAVENPLRHFVAAATAVLEADGEALGSFVNELVSLFRVEGKSAGPEGGAPQLVARLGAEMLLGRAFALGRWRALMNIARPKVSESGRVDNWIFFNSFIHPRMFDSNGHWPGVLVMDLLREDDLNDELGLASEKASAAAAEANMLLGVVNYAKRQNDNKDMPYSWGFGGTGPREVVHAVFANEQLIDQLAEFAGEPSVAFREQFSKRFQELFRAVNRENWTVTLFDETVTLLDEISRAGQISSGRNPSKLSNP